mgnify:CR=1 FL=1
MAHPLPSDQPQSDLRPTSAETRAAAVAEVMAPGHGFASVTQKVTQIVLRPGIAPGWAFGFLVAFGITAMFFWQIVINLGMVAGVLPVVGVPLPFISYGGSFLITSMIAAGLLLNINMRRFIF